MKQRLLMLLIAASLTSCTDGNSTEVGHNMAFAWYDSHDYTNVYYGGDPRDGGVPVIPSGCDSAKWNDRYVLTKGEAWRYIDNDVWHITQVPADSLFYFVVDTKRYEGHQELDPALHGPLTRMEQLEWEQRIPGPYHVPD